MDRLNSEAINRATFNNPFLTLIRFLLSNHFRLERHTTKERSLESHNILRIISWRYKEGGTANGRVEGREKKRHKLEGHDWGNTRMESVSADCDTMLYYQGRACYPIRSGLSNTASQRPLSSQLRALLICSNRDLRIGIWEWSRRAECWNVTNLGLWASGGHNFGAF